LDLNLPLHLMLLMTGNDLWRPSHRLKTGAFVDLNPML
jgi:hypothetical protein